MHGTNMKIFVTLLFFSIPLTPREFLQHTVFTYPPRTAVRRHTYLKCMKYYHRSRYHAYLFLCTALRLQPSHTMLLFCHLDTAGLSKRRGIWIHAVHRPFKHITTCHSTVSYCKYRTNLMHLPAQVWCKRSLNTTKQHIIVYYSLEERYRHEQLSICPTVTNFQIFNEVTEFYEN